MFGRSIIQHILLVGGHPRNEGRVTDIGTLRSIESDEYQYERPRTLTCPYANLNASSSRCTLKLLLISREKSS